MHNHRIDHIRKERDREVFENAFDESIPREDLQRDERESDRDHQPGDGGADDDPRCVGDSAEIGADVDGIRDDHEPDGRIENPSRVVLFEDSSEAST